MRAVIDTGGFASALIRRQGTTGDVLSALKSPQGLCKVLRYVTLPKDIGTM